MNNEKIGNLIKLFRKEKNLTQQQLASQLNVSDRTISKWECGNGCPDITSLNNLASIMEINIEKLLDGELIENPKNIGKLSLINFYICPNCDNVIFSFGNSDISCCSKKLKPANIVKSDADHSLEITEIENDYYITSEHAMNKQHFIQFIACVSLDRVILIKTYPEQSLEVRIPRMPHSHFFAYCNQHGIWTQDI